MLKLSAWIDDLQVVCHSREQIFFFFSPFLVLDRSNFLCVWTGISITLPFLTGEYLPLGYKGDRGGRDHRTGQKEDGIGPSGDSAHGYHWPNGSGKQLWKVQVSGRGSRSQFYIIISCNTFILLMRCSTTDINLLITWKGPSQNCKMTFSFYFAFPVSPSSFLFYFLAYQPSACAFLSFLPCSPASCFWLCLCRTTQQRQLCARQQAFCLAQNCLGLFSELAAVSYYW